MPDVLDRARLIRALRAAAARVRAEADALGRLDSVIGDGDHGVAMCRAMDAIEQTLDAAGAEPTDQSGATGDSRTAALLEAVAWAVMSIDAGSTGPLLGSLLLGMAEAAGPGGPIDAPRWAAMFAAGVEKLRGISGAGPGDKTMVDGLVPAAEALRRAADQGAGIAEALRRAADAARQGAEDTRQWEAKFGKARNLGARSIGHADPGATSVAVWLAGLADGAAET
mgnify:CR=1 FL=1